MGATVERIVADKRALIVTLLRVFDPAAIYLFGSHGTAREHPCSDVDLAILPRSPLDPLACFATANELSNQLGVAVDLIDLSRASTVLAKEVLRTGTPLAVADSLACQAFEMRTLADYARLNEERAPILASTP
jgi:predicted nucleotidyltransferase